jgi:hypothetical protein
MIHEITPPSIPDKVSEFAKAVAKLANEYGIDEFRMNLKPHRRKMELDRRIHGDMHVVFSASDGRGRPCQNLSIQLQANFTVQIVENPESFN